MRALTPEFSRQREKDVAFRRHWKKEGTRSGRTKTEERGPKELSGVVETRRAAERERERPSQRRASEEITGTEAKNATEQRPKGTVLEGPRGSQRERQAQESKGSKAGDQASKAKSKGQYGPRSGDW
eukprot:CAMPEP_0201117000 /NCGR_PEP_ID=MMETSP0850-20130426/1122_1 /ASSEMBLY_ACC=CAM_ASM_000622 /TAXON_ID=183588 /ORGANISM="Pseudo-nitzschia fraudulenta, Strain WWA7" /LENGTH=126 /DNA_ID=CAMNT_0047381233 /DNA_START=356 /DNA_END=733 /DNA_ORIENTATION=+